MTIQTPAPASKTGFGFDEIMRRPDHGRFPAWYARASRLAAGRPTTGAA
jgi:hypothetical protein